MKLKWLMAVLLAGSCWGAAAQVLSPDQLQSDFKLFRKALHEAHPGMYRYTSKAAFDAKFDSVYALLRQPMTRQAFYVAMTPLVTALREGHTKWMAKGQPEKYPFHDNQLFPLKLYFVGKQAWVAGNYGTTEVAAGAEVVAINGEPIAAVIEALLPQMTFADGNTRNGKYEDLNRYFPGLYDTFIGTADTFQIVYRQDNQAKTVSLPAVSLKTIDAYYEQHAPAPRKPARITYLDNQTALLTIERFWFDKKEMDFKAFLKDTFRQLKEKKTKHLIIDLRNNEGGTDLYGTLLYSYLAGKPFRYYQRINVAQKKKLSFDAWEPGLFKLARVLLVHKTDSGYVLNSRRRLKEWKPQREAFTGEVYALINGNSFSVTTEFASVLHHHKRATFIGQETAGGYYGDTSGAFAIVTLPNSQLELGIPLMDYYSAVSGYPYPDRGIIPDYTVVPTITEVLRGDDPVLQRTRELIRQKDEQTADK